MTDEEIDAITYAQWGEMKGFPLAAHRDYARAIEAAATAPLLERIAALEAESTRLEGLVYSPGLWRCAKCKFTLVQRNLNAHSGTVTARDQPGDKCPNCDVNLWRVTERENALENYEAAESLQIRLNALEAKLAQRVPAWKLERMRHVANEWADMAINGLQHLRNLKDGIGAADLCAANMEECLAHCRKVNDAPGLYGQPEAPAAPEQQEFDDCSQSPSGKHSESWFANGDCTYCKTGAQPNAPLFYPDAAQAPNAQQAEAQEPDDAALLKALNEIKPMDRTKLFEMAVPLTREEIAEAESDRAIPKAWANFTPDGNIRIWSKKPESVAWSGLELVPLFTRPQPAQLQALSEFEEGMLVIEHMGPAALAGDSMTLMEAFDKGMKAGQSALAAKNGAELK